MSNKRLLALATISLLSISCAQTGDEGGTGGAPGTGGSSSTGGTTGTGGSSSTGGTTGTGGSHTGGTTGTGGNATGGVVGTGGSHTGGAGGSPGGAGGHATGGSAGGTSGGGSTGTGGVSSGGGVSGGASAENTGATSCTASAGALLSADNKKLPNPFAKHDGTIISKKSDWECRRQEIMQDLYKYEVGAKPDPSATTVTSTLSGSKLSVVVTSKDGSLTLTSTVSGSGSCVVIGMDGNSSMVMGCTQIPFTSSQVVQMMQNSNRYQSDPYYKVFPSAWNTNGNYSAWSWGISRLIDGIIQQKDALKVDVTKIAVHGCSYAGKMALFGGALDERVALTVVEESGGGGIDSWRMSQEFTDRTGTSVEKIDNTNYAWFMTSMQKLDPYKLPHDHHELIALIAPRPVIILGNDDYDWLGDESGYKSTMAAIQVFTAMGAANAIGYDFTSGHKHCQPPTTQQNSVTAFVKRFLQGGSTDPNIAIKPPSTKFNLDLTTAIDWTAPTLQ
jgi:hypothetical protein